MFRNRLCIDGGLTLFMPPTSAAQTVCGKICRNLINCCLAANSPCLLFMCHNRFKEVLMMIPLSVHNVFVSESSAIADAYFS